MRGREADPPSLTDQEELMYSAAMARALARTRSLRVEASTLFHALSDETRLAVLEMLRSGERCVCDLQDALDAAQSRLSFHLKVLKDAGLVHDRRQGRWSYYSLDAERVAEARGLLDAIATPAPAAPTLHPIARRAAGASSAAASSSEKAAARASRRSSPEGGCC